MSALTAERKRVFASAPFAATRISEYRRSTFNDSFRLGVGDKEWRLQCGRAYRTEVDRLLARAG